MDDFFKQAAEEYLNALSNSLPQPEDCRHSFGKRFEKRMRLLIAKTLHPVRTAMMVMYVLFGGMLATTWVQIIKAVLLLFGSVLAIDVDAREAFFGWLMEQNTLFSHFVFTRDSAEPDLAQFYPGWIPDGYSLYDNYSIQNGQVFLYSNDLGDILSFIYTSSPENLEVYVYTEACSQETLSVHGDDAQLYIPEDTTEASELIWQDSHGTLFLVSGKCGKTVLVQFAEKIFKK